LAAGRASSVLAAGLLYGVGGGRWYLAGWLFDQLVGWLLVVWLVGWLIGRFVSHWLVGEMVGW